jgi:hypothetical protein
MVQQAAGRCDQHVGAPIELLKLFGERHAADQQRRGQLRILAVNLERIGDLRRKFACRLEDQRSRHPRLGAALAEDVDHRQRNACFWIGVGCS